MQVCRTFTQLKCEHIIAFLGLKLSKMMLDFSFLLMGNSVSKTPLNKRVKTEKEAADMSRM